LRLAMGNFLRRRKEASVELEGLVKEIKDLEERLRSLGQQRRTVVFYLALILFFLSSVFTGSAWNFTRYTRNVRVGIGIASTLASVVLFVLLKNLALAYLNYSYNAKQSRLELLQERRREIIENVKENEKFKVAKAIIEKYGGEEDLAAIGVKSERKQEAQQSTKKPLNGTPDVIGDSGDQVRANNVKRVVLTPPPDPNSQSSMGPRPIGNAPSKMPATPKPMHSIASGPQTPENRVPIRPFVEANRTPIERVIDYVIGDGPANRYALICGNCHSHNGMALREEYEHISYYCFKCNFFNQSRRRTRLPPAPPRGKEGVKYEAPARTTESNRSHTPSAQSDSDSERKMSSDSASDSVPHSVPTANIQETLMKAVNNDQLSTTTKN
jgi:hypothetical protein